MARAGGLEWLVAATLALAAPVASAHHAWTEIEPGRELTLTGRVKSVRWENPHASLVLETLDGDRRDEWQVQMSGTARMESREITADVVAVGRTLTIVAVPFRGETRVVRANRIRTAGKDHVLY